MLANRLRAAGVEIYIFEDQEDLATPDAVFPNNWVSFHDDGTVVLYPMFAPSRRPERRRDIIENLQSSGFRVSRIVDLTPHETEGSFLEGTGSVVFDHVQHVAYATFSAAHASRSVSRVVRGPGLQTGHIRGRQRERTGNQTHGYDDEHRRASGRCLCRCDPGSSRA